MQQNSSKLYSLQACRGLAACAVVLYHFTFSSQYFLGSIPFFSFFLFGHAGVDFFFVLSGFIISYVHHNDLGAPKKLISFALKRVTRIYPMYWPILIMITCMYFFLGAATVGVHTTDEITFGYFIRSFFLIEYLHQPILNVAWTLVYEVFFYFVFAILILNKRLGLFCFFVWICLIFINFCIPFHNSVFLNFVSSYHNAEFLIGCLCAWLILKQGQWIQHPLCIVFVGVFLFTFNGAIEVYFLHDMNTRTDILYGISSFMIILGLVKLEQTKAISVPKSLVLLGGSSYAIYLMNNLIVSILYRPFAKIIHKIPASMHVLTVDLMMIVGLCITILVGISYYSFYEKPTLNYFRRKLILPYESRWNKHHVG